MFNAIKLDQLLVLDIETVPQHENFDALSPQMQALWDKKSQYQRQNHESAGDFYERAGIWAEFGKVICISVGAFYLKNKQAHLRVQSFAESDEKLLLKLFCKFLNEQKDSLRLCAHNGKEFDFPYLCRRILINGLALPNILNLAGKKPWEINHIDTMEMWKFGDYKHYTSLELLAAIFDIPSPKTDLDGSQVKNTYYLEKNLERIVSYCQNDVITTAQILLRYKGLPLLQDQNISYTKPC